MKHSVKCVSSFHYIVDIQWNPTLFINQVRSHRLNNVNFHTYSILAPLAELCYAFYHSLDTSCLGAPAWDSKATVRASEYLSRMEHFIFPLALI